MSASREDLNILQKPFLIMTVIAVLVAVVSLGTYSAFATSALEQLGEMLGANASGTDASGDDNPSDIVLLSHRYNQGQFGDEIVGEILNNGTRSLGMFDIPISASFYDSAGQLVGSENGFTEGQEVGEGGRAAFSISILDDSLIQEAVTYDLLIDSQRVVEGQPLQESSGSSNEDEDDEGSGDN